MKIDVSPPDNEFSDFLSKKIDDELEHKGAAIPFVFFIRDKKQAIIAGCSGEVMFGSVHTNLLWVDPDYREQGLGHKLMEQIHRHGVKSGCHIATVISMDFQNARKFYENLGYICDLERKGYVDGSSCLFFSKVL
ncbi:MAG: GNAT family N-acetyltransferase [Legionellales bacterium RIFCSPHIGHO2_12_FULL_42_9]|nr:MAG: GNAT family N-acetyltransferase [Legionellales bacterium RIFCSPHIGHO2_12_FULL_42_9]